MKTPHKNWIRERYGDGSTLKLADGLSCQINWSLLKERDYEVSAFGVRLKKDVENREEAMLRAEALARKLLKEALQKLDENNEGPQP